MRFKNSYWLIVVLLTALIVVGCNRYANQPTEQSKTEDQQTITKAETEQTNTSNKQTTMVDPSDYPWYYNPNNTWLKEREGLGGRFKNPAKRPNIDSIFTHYKHHLGFGPDDTFEMKKRDDWGNGIEYTFLRYYKGILVKPDFISVSCDKNDNVSIIDAKWIQDLNKIYQEPQLALEDAVKIAVTEIKAKKYAVWGPRELGYYKLSGSSNKLTQCWNFNIDKNSPLPRIPFRVKVNAINGNIEYIEENSAHDNVCSREIQASFPINTNENNAGLFELTNIENNTSTKTNQGWAASGGGCLDNGTNKIISNDGWHCNHNSIVEAESHLAVELAFEFFYDLLDIDVFPVITEYIDNNNSCQSLNDPIKVEVLTNFESLGNKTQLFGDGTVISIAKSNQNFIHPLTNYPNLNQKNRNSFDIIGHEFTHFAIKQLREFSANLAPNVNSIITRTYEESICDFWGSLIEQSIIGNKVDVWLYGNKYISNNEILQRSLSNPNEYYFHKELDANSNCNWEVGQPDYYRQDNFFNYVSGSCNVDASDIKYINNGIFNHWMYLLVNGGENESIITKINNNDVNLNAEPNESTKKVKGLGFEAAKQIIHLTRKTMPASANLHKIVENSINETIKLITDSNGNQIGTPDDWSNPNHCDNRLIQVVRAWRAVGIDIDNDIYDEFGIRVIDNLDLPDCITCRSDCDTDNFINGDLEIGLNCDNDPSTALADCNCADIPIDLELYQYSVEPSLVDCYGVDIQSGSITIIPQFGVTDCSIQLCNTNNGNCFTITDETTIPNHPAGSYPFQLENLNNGDILPINITIPTKEFKPINYQIVKDTKDANCIPDCIGSILVDYNLQAGEKIIWTCNPSTNSNFINCNSCDCSSVDLANITEDVTFLSGLCPGLYSFTIEDADGNCLFTKSTGVSIAPANQIESTRLSVYPNVYQSQTNIEIELDQSEDVILRVFDASGNPIEDLLNGQTLNSGVTNIPFNASGDPDGIHVFQLQTLSPCPVIKGEIGIKH